MFAIVWHDHDGASRVIAPFESDAVATAYVTTDPDLSNSPGTCVLPLDAPAEIVPDAELVDPGCGCYAGILVMNGSELQRCDDCRVLADDNVAIAIVKSLLAERAKQLVAPEPPF